MSQAKQADLAGPGIGNYEDLEKILPQGYSSILTPRETQQALWAVKAAIEETPCWQPDAAASPPLAVFETCFGIRPSLLAIALFCSSSKTFSW